MEGRWEKRWQPLRREWVVVSAHRNQRPWQGERETLVPKKQPSYDPDCFLCPGNRRIGGAVNPDYKGVYVFDNDHPVVGPNAPDAAAPAAPARGLARVMCYHPDHSRTVGDLSDDEIHAVLHTWAEQTAELGARPGIQHVQIFENRGEMCGTSSPHPHCQIYATDFVMANTALMLEALEHDEATFTKLLRFERDDPRRRLPLVDGVDAFVPYAARFPYEVWLFPERPAARIHEMREDERMALGEAYRELVRTYDALFGMPFPYVMALHQAPTDGLPHPHLHCHLAFYPPLRAPGLRKIIAGAELGGGNFMNDTVPEETAAQLREAHARTRSEVPA